MKWKFEKGDIIPLVSIAKNIFKDPDYEAYFEFIPFADGSIRLNPHAHHQSKIYKHIKKDVVLWKPSKEMLVTLTGKFYSKHLDFYWTIIQNEDGRLIIKRPTIDDTELEPEAENEFLMKVEKYSGNSFDAYVRFHNDDQGNITHLTVWHARLMHHRFDKIIQ